MDRAVILNRAGIAVYYIVYHMDKLYTALGMSSIIMPEQRERLDDIVAELREIEWYPTEEDRMLVMASIAVSQTEREYGQWGNA